MQVVILCGGLGTRLREETEFRPKPMVNIGLKPILWHIMKIYAHFGYSDFILALGYKGETIKHFFWHYELMNNDITIELGKTEKVTIHNKCNEDGWRITLVNTGEKALKGARIKKLEKFIRNDRFLMTYGDTVANIDIKKLVEFHQGHGKIATVTGVNPASRFGEMKLNGNAVDIFEEKPNRTENRLANGGFFVFEKEIFDYLNDNDNCDFEYGPLEEITGNGQLMVYKHEGFWACMDTYRDMEYLNNLWKNGKAKWKIW
jgi:glucose-1-phosphate cytidylyltransferase